MAKLWLAYFSELGEAQALLEVIGASPTSSNLG